jgi:hypothetical protein
MIWLADEHVARSRHCRNVAGLAGIELDFLPQMADMSLDERRVGLIPVSPHVRHDLI